MKDVVLFGKNQVVELNSVIKQRIKMVSVVAAEPSGTWVAFGDGPGPVAKGISYSEVMDAAELAGVADPSVYKVVETSQDVEATKKSVLGEVKREQYFRAQRALTICHNCANRPNPLSTDTEWRCMANPSTDVVSGKSIGTLCRVKNTGKCTDFERLVDPRGAIYPQIGSELQ